ncbi:MAG TPA: hypothetical protein VMU84_11235, partial [Thermoanaerobaculia bacterium]|nr:hypothetical protein [Thermoanaerobaculia bacterium]
MLEFRPRPPLWRLALVSASQILVAVWLTSLAIAAMEIVAMQRWIFYATPWGVGASGIDPQIIGIATVVACALAAIALWLWPTRQTLATRHFAHVVAQVLAIYGVGRLAPRAPLMYSAPTLVAAIVIAFVAERRVLSLLGNIFALTLRTRLELWCLRIAPVAGFLGAMSWLARDILGIYLACAFAAIPFAVAFVEPPKRFERVDDLHLQRIAKIAIVAFILIAGSAALFG